MDDGVFDQLRRRWTLRFGRPAKDRLGPGRIVKLVGEVLADEAPRTSPLGGREAVIYTVKGSRVEGYGRSRRVITIADEEWSCDFWLDSEAGRLRVEPDGWLTLLAPRRRIGDSPQTQANLDDFADRYGNHEREFFEGFGGGAAYHEQTVEVGATVAVIGEVHEVGLAADGGYRESRTQHALRPPATGRLWISTRPAHIGG